MPDQGWWSGGHYYSTQYTATTSSITYNAYDYDCWRSGTTTSAGTYTWYRPQRVSAATNAWYPTSNNNVVWEYWNEAPYRQIAPPAQVAAILRTTEERHQQRQAASVRARALLEDFLSAEQKAELEQGYFHVVGSRGRRYRIRAQGQAGNVELLRPDGGLQARLCAHPRNHLPDADAWLVQMIELRHNEDNFLRTANVHAGHLPGDLYAAAA